MALDKDSAIIEIRATGDGYYVQLFQWPVSPPPLPRSIALVVDNNTDVPTSQRIDDVSTSKTELKAVLNTWVDNLFDQ